MDDLHKVNGEPPVERYAPPSAPYTIDLAIADALAAINEVDATVATRGGAAAVPSPDALVVEAGVQYWIWTGSRLVRASSVAGERVRQREELAQEELRRQAGRKRAHRLRRRQARKHFIIRLVSPLRQSVATLYSWLQYLKGQERVQGIDGIDGIDGIERVEKEAHGNDAIG